MPPSAPNSNVETGSPAAAGYIRAFSTLGCPDLNLAQVIALAQSQGIAAVELRALAGSLDLPRYFSERGESPAALVTAAGGPEVRCASLSTSFSLIDGTHAEREKLLEFVPWAEAMGIPRLRVFDGGRTADDAELARAADTMDWWAGVRSAQGWKTDLMVETHDALRDAAAIARFMRRVPDTALLWDSHHTWRNGGEDPGVTWRAIGQHVVHIHVKDSIRATDTSRPCTYVLPGTGEFPMAVLREALAGEFAGPLSLEWEKLWHPELPSLEAALLSATATAWW